MGIQVRKPAFGLAAATYVLLGSLFLVGLAALAVLPGLSRDIASSLPEYASLRVPLLSLSIAVIVLGLAAIALLALLLHRTYTDTILVRSSVRWVDALACVLAGAVALDITAYAVISEAQAGNPAIALVQIVACSTLLTFACITLAIRSRIRDAIAMSSQATRTA